MATLNSSTLGKHTIDLGNLDNADTVTPGVAVTDPAALTAGPSSPVAPTETEYNELLADVTAIRTQLVALITSLENADLIA